MYLKVADKYRINLKEILKNYGWHIEPEHQYLYKVIDDGLYKAELFIYITNKSDFIPYRLYLETYTALVIDQLGDILSLYNIGILEDCFK